MAKTLELADLRPERPESASNGTETAELSPRQEACAVEIASGKTLAQTARVTKIGETTVKRWYSEACFHARVQSLRMEMTSAAMGRLADHMTAAADTLGALVKKGKSETVRLGAARAILEMGLKLREQLDLENRLAALEHSR